MVHPDGQGGVLLGGLFTESDALKHHVEGDMELTNDSGIIDFEKIGYLNMLLERALLTGDKKNAAKIRRLIKNISAGGYYQRLTPTNKSKLKEKYFSYQNENVGRAPKSIRACDIASLARITSRPLQNKYIADCRNLSRTNKFNELSVPEILALKELVEYKRPPKRPSQFERKSRKKVPLVQIVQ
jgi:hypothetical protein